MCKALDDNISASCTATSNDNGSQLPPKLSSSSTIPPQQRQRRQRRVHFGDDHHAMAHIVEIPKAMTAEEKSLLWYNKQEFQRIRLDIGLLLQRVRAQAANSWMSFLADESDYECDVVWPLDNPVTLHNDCTRGLEFLKWSDQEPSRKERRLAFCKSVVIFQIMLKGKKRSSSSSSSRHNNALLMEQALATYSSKLSRDAAERARELASMDESEARQVYHECHMIYQVNGREVSMFPSSCSSSSSSSSNTCCSSNALHLQQQQQQQRALGTSSICRQEIIPPPSSFYGFSYSSWLQVFHTVTSTALFTAHVN